jgi:protein-tyrosine-phosphatase
MPDRPSVLFVCVHNAGRSQMAAALLGREAGGRIEIRSAGSEPADTLHPAVLAVLAEGGIDLTAERPRRWSIEDVEASDVVITMGCGDTCPVFPGKRYLDWDLADPAGLDIDHVRAIRDDIATRVRALARDLLGPQI